MNQTAGAAPSPTIEARETLDAEPIQLRVDEVIEQEGRLMVLVPMSSLAEHVRDLTQPGISVIGGKLVMQRKYSADSDRLTVITFKDPEA